MDLEKYKNEATQSLNKSIAHDSKERMYYACMGLIEETGEIIAELSKTFFKGNFHEKVFDIDEIKSELGDLMWYISLICKYENIDMNQLHYQEEDEKISKREKIIKISIKMGQVSGGIVEEYQKLFKDKSQFKDKSKLIGKIKEQYYNVCDLAKKLNLTIDEILSENVRKVNSRYNERGEANNSEECEK